MPRGWCSAVSPSRPPTSSAAATRRPTRPHVDTGDFVVVINAEKVVLTGKKEEQNEYMFFSGFVGGESYRKLARCASASPSSSSSTPSRACCRRTGSPRKMLTKLRVFAGPKHTHEAQNPVKISV